MRRQGIVAGVLLAMLSTAALAQGIEVPPGASPPAVTSAPELDPAVALQLLLGENATRMTVPVSINRSPTYPFVIDTGAERTVLSRELARVLALADGPRVRLTAVTATQQVGTVHVPLVSVSSLEGGAIDAPTLAGENLGAPGMLGIDLLQAHRVSIDFRKNLMMVMPSQKRARPSEPSSPNEVVVRARNLFGQLIVTEASLGNTRIKVVLDTGAAITMGNSAFGKLINRRLRPDRTVEIVDVTGGSVAAPYALVDNVSIGGVGFGGLPVAIADVLPFKRFGLTDQPALLLGMDALRAFDHVTIDFANREVRFTLPPGVGVQEPGRWSAHPA